MAARKTPAKPMNRSSGGLRDALFDTMDSLVRGDCTPQHATAVSKVATTIIASGKLDLDYKRFVSQGEKPQLNTDPLRALTNDK